jgi:hypothetical protein
MFNTNSSITLLALDNDVSKFAIGIIICAIIIEMFAEIMFHWIKKIIEKIDEKNHQKYDQKNDILINELKKKDQEIQELRNKLFNIPASNVKASEQSSQQKINCDNCNTLYNQDQVKQYYWSTDNKFCNMCINEIIINEM